MKTTILHLRAPHDTNGNPRRVFVVIDASGKEDGRTLGVFDEGYAGNRAVPEEMRNAAIAEVTIEVTPKEYKEWLKIGVELAKGN